MTEASGEYAEINGLRMYYEQHGPDDGVPLVLLHGALSATRSSFGAVLPGLAEGRRVISVEQQSHGHTPDIDRPLSVGQMADDTVALLTHLGIEQADFLGYSMGAGIALHLAVQQSPVVRRIVLATVSFKNSGLHPELVENVTAVTPEQLAGSPWEAEYLEVAPNKDDWPVLVRKVGELNADLPQFTDDQIRTIDVPVLVILGDSDIVRPEHGVELFRLLGGGVIGEFHGMPRSQLALIPGTPHSELMTRSAALLAIIPPFLDKD